MYYIFLYENGFERLKMGGIATDGSYYSNSTPSMGYLRILKNLTWNKKLEKFAETWEYQVETQGLNRKLLMRLYYDVHHGRSFSTVSQNNIQKAFFIQFHSNNLHSNNTLNNPEKSFHSNKIRSAKFIKLNDPQWIANVIE